jgi:hypothetical protein
MEKKASPGCHGKEKKKNKAPIFCCYMFVCFSYIIIILLLYKKKKMINAFLACQMKW